PGRYEDNVVPIGFLREQGLQIDVVDEPVLVKEGAK
ncbi:MAG: methionine ABC transporter ATP-binding protein, partial [Streptomyces sp.]|nr:methionine ABC transporter ATP-binding protein [Streptomyces sp.]NUS28656.1 methionine ABC transporter ATP-binding protein [Streptomyces sp.]